jgi:hypothetical protein
VPVMTQIEGDHFVACHHPLEPGEQLTPVSLAGAQA